ncbi:MAG: winged helix-turn-helix transcriptional regulator, partial [Clostridia bacterium]|nr:winged helix-turn-helix transcriptional regulator [Clostridia bacterium]
ITVDNEEIKLTQTEYNIIALLSQHCGKVMTYSAIISAIWGYNDIGSTKKLQVNMANLRKKFGAVPGKDNYIVNELGVGYKMNETVK